MYIKNALLYINKKAKAQVIWVLYRKGNKDYKSRKMFREVSWILMQVWFINHTGICKITGLITVCSSPLLLKVWSRNEQWPLSGACWKCRTSASIPDLLNQNLQFSKIPKWFIGTLKFEEHNFGDSELS